MKHTILFIAIGLFMAASLTGADGLVLVVNKDNSMNELSAADAQAFFLGKKTSFPNGQAVLVVLLEGGGTHDVFLSKIVRKNSSQFDAYWKKVIFTGTGAAPKYVKNEAEMIQIVKGNANAIGYLGSENAEVKTIGVK